MNEAVYYGFWIKEEGQKPNVLGLAEIMKIEKALEAGTAKVTKGKDGLSNIEFENGAVYEECVSIG